MDLIYILYWTKFICTAMNRNHLQSREEIFALGNFHFLLVSLFLQCCITTCCCCSVAKSCLTLCDPVDFSVPGFPVLHDLLEFAQMHVHWVSGTMQPSHPQLLPSPPALNLSQRWGIFQWAGSSHQVIKVLTKYNA